MVFPTGYWNSHGSANCAARVVLNNVCFRALIKLSTTSWQDDGEKRLSRHVRGMRTGWDDGSLAAVSNEPVLDLSLLS